LGYFNQNNSWALFTIVGPMTALWYFTSFYFAIGFFDFKTPGREEDTEAETASGHITDRSREILSALGGSSNLIDLDACITRLRISVADAAKVNVARLKTLGAAGTLNAGGGNFQIIFGVESDHIREEISSIIKSEKTGLAAVANGRVMSVSEVPDPTFAEKVLGDGYAIDPTDGLISSPAKGEITTVFRTNHALGLKTDSGQEILIHVGIDTVKLDGRGFRMLVQPNQRVNIGDPLIEFDMDVVRQEAKSLITPVLITNLDTVDGLNFTKMGQVRSGDSVVQYQARL
jgi:glucose PTS system EIICBA or EIICB component